MIKGNIEKNLAIYTLFLGVAAAGILYGRQLQSSAGNLRVWEWTNLLWLLLGVPFLFLQRKAGLPDFLEKGIPQYRRFLIPLAIGIVFGLLDVWVFQVLLHPEPYKALPPFTQPFPYSLFLYFSGAFEVEVFYRLIPLTLLLLVGSTLWKGRYFMVFWWVAALATSIREPLEQMPSGSSLLISYSLLSGFLMNFLQAIWYRKAGFLSSLSVRLGHYLVWHILLGMYIQFIVIG
jgi:hypothetical protein